MLVAAMIALAYMHSKVRMDAQTEMWAKDEAKNLAISVLLFACIFVFFSGSCMLAMQYTKNAVNPSSSDDGMSPFSAAKSYMNNLLENNGKSVLRALTKMSINDQKAATKFSYLGAAPFWGTGVGPDANRRALSSHKELVIDIYLPIVASLTAQKYLLDAMQWVGASLLLPFAFVMRLIPFTREFGNFLIAIFFGIYIVVPFMYALSGAVFTNDILGPGSHGYWNNPNNNYKDNFYSYGLDGGDKATMSTEDTVLFRIGSTIPQAVFIPNLVLVVGITCIMAMSKALHAIAM